MGYEGRQVKVLPHSEEFERAALASALLEEQAMGCLLNMVEEKDFYFPIHRVVYNTIKELSRQQRPVDIVHLLEMNQTPEVKICITELFDYIPSAKGIESFCANIVELSDRRKAINILQESMEELFDIESQEPIQKAQSKILSIVRTKGNESRDLNNLVEDAYARTWNAYEARKRGEYRSAAHIRTGLLDMDDALTMKRGDMIVVGARPSAGKTSIGLQIALHAAKEKPLLFFSLEEPANQIADRYLTAMTGIGMRKIQEGNLTEAEMDKIAHAQTSSEFVRLVVNDTTGLRVTDMKNIALRLQVSRGEPFGAIMIDHMIKIKGDNPGATGHHKLTQVSQDIKNMARHLNIPVIVLTQLRRPMDESSEPNMSDLRESGSIEEDADSILLIHRPDRDKGFSVAKFLLKKQRTGPCATFEYIFEADKMRFLPNTGQAMAPRGFGVL
jgi:replicative DNA helicase